MEHLKTVELPVLMLENVLRNVQSALAVIKDPSHPYFLKVSAAETAMEHVQIYVKNYTEDKAKFLLSQNLPMAMMALHQNTVMLKTATGKWQVNSISYNADRTAFLEPCSELFDNPMHAISDFFDKKGKEESV